MLQISWADASDQVKPRRKSTVTGNTAIAPTSSQRRHPSIEVSHCANLHRTRQGAQAAISPPPNEATQQSPYVGPSALPASSQLRRDLEAKGPRLTRRDVVVAVGRGPIALVEDVLDIELRLPGRVDLRVDAGVEAQE